MIFLRTSRLTIMYPYENDELELSHRCSQVNM